MIKRVQYYAKVIVDMTYREYKCGTVFNTREEAEQDLLRLMDKYNSCGGYVEAYRNY